MTMHLPTQFEIAEEGRNNSTSMPRAEFKLTILIPELGSRDSVVGIATGYGQDGRGLREFESR
jgi:hypothetical protein